MNLFRVSPAGERLGTLRPLDYELVEEYNRPRFLQLTVTEQVAENDRLVLIDETLRPLEFIVHELHTIKDNSGTRYEVWARDSLYELRGETIEPRTIPTISPANALPEVLKGTRWTAGQVTNAEAKDLEITGTDIYSALSAVVSAYGVGIESEFTANGTRILSRRVNLLGGSGFTGRRFEWGKDVTEITRKVKTDHIITALYVYGATLETDDEELDPNAEPPRLTIEAVNGGKAYLENARALELFGLSDGKGAPKRHVYGVAVFDDIEDPSELKKKGEEALAVAVQPVVSYTATIENLAVFGQDWGAVKLGDLVQVTDEELGAIRARVVKRVNRPSVRDEITLGNYMDAYGDEARRAEATAQALQSGAKTWDAAKALKNGGIEASKLIGLLDAFNSELEGKGGNTRAVAGQGIITEGPAGAVQIVEGGLRIASRKRSDGSWDWTTVATGRGFIAKEMFAGKITGDLIEAGAINADHIRSGSISTDKLGAIEISADQIKAGRIRSKGGGSYFDLNTGEIVASRGTFSGYVDTAEIKNSSFNSKFGNFSMALGHGEFQVNGLTAMALGVLSGYATQFVIGQRCGIGGRAGFAQIELCPIQVDDNGLKIKAGTGSMAYLGSRGGYWLSLERNSGTVWGVDFWGNITSRSDAKYKKKIKPAKRGRVLSFLRALTVKTYKNTLTERDELGLVAQDVKEAEDKELAELLLSQNEGGLMLDYGMLGRYTLAGLLDLAAEVEELRARVTQLEGGKE